MSADVEGLAAVIDPEAFEAHPIEARSHAAALQWGARRLMATKAAVAVLASDWLRDLLAAERREGQRDGWDEGLRFGQLHWATNYAGVYQNGSPLRQAPNPYRDNQTGATR